MKKIKNYTLIAGGDATKFTDAINDFLKKDYQPYKGLISFKNANMPYFVQAMVIYEDCKKCKE